MKQLMAIMLVTFLLAPIFTLSAQASTTIDNQVAVVNNLNNSDTMGSVEKVRNNNNNGSYDDFIHKLREPSIPIAITLITLSGLLFLVGFWIPTLKKIAGTIIGGVFIGLLFINFGEYVIGGMFAVYDFIVGYF